jgi:nucleotide-binding universal stress UspA family protein
MIVLHVQRLEVPVYFTVAQAEALKAQLRRSARAAQKHAREFADGYLGGGTKFTTRVVEDDPASGILKAQREVGADLIAMGTHGRSGLARLRLGSVTETVLHQANVPVLTLGPGVPPDPLPSGIRRVLCPVNYAPSARATLEHAAAVAGRAKADLIVMHIGEAQLGRTEQDSMARLCEWISPDVRARCAVKEVVRQGGAAEQIVKGAAEFHADLLVIGVQPRGLLGVTLLGSTSELVIRSSPCPVLSVVGKG